MPEQKYLLWSVRANGWLTFSSTYVSRIKEAGQFGEPDAFNRCRAHVNQAEPGLIPVALDDINSFMEVTW